MSRSHASGAERIPGRDSGEPGGTIGSSPLTRILVVAGPTGTGKSAVAVSVAEELGGEVVGCDALQVYRGFDTGTAKPDTGLRSRVPHHLLDIVDPRRDYSVADYVIDADRTIAAISARGLIPIVSGGTGMYLRGLLKGIVKAPPRDEALRERLGRLGRRFGTTRLHRWLTRLDPATAARVSPRDFQRVLRALEIALVGERRAWSERLATEGTWAAPSERYEAWKVGLDLPRELLRARLEARIDGFFRAGLVDEVERLLRSGIPRTANAFKAIGYREVLAARDAGRDPRETRGEILRSTVRYAKRQRTWFRAEPGIRWLDASAGVAPTACLITRAWLETSR